MGFKFTSSLLILGLLMDCQTANAQTDKKQKSEKNETVSANNGSDSIATVEFASKVYLKVVDGCRYMWPYSEKLQKKCVISELENVKSLTEEIAISNPNK